MEIQKNIDFFRRNLFKIYSQVEFLMPDRVEFLGHSLCPFLHFAHLDSDIGVRCPTLVLRNQALGTYHCGEMGEMIKFVCYLYSSLNYFSLGN